MARAYYSKNIQDFLIEDTESILGCLVIQHDFAVDERSRNAWIGQIEILKQNLKCINTGHVFIEYSIPRMGKRADTIVLIRGVIYVIEFKVGERHYSGHALDQVMDYGLDLKNFHEESHHRPIVPILIATEAERVENFLKQDEDLLYQPLMANKQNLGQILLDAMEVVSGMEIDPTVWCDSIYKPTPTIIEAAQALYRGHSVTEISRADAGTINLSLTSQSIFNIIDQAKLGSHKAICFVTGVPGAGKTLAGLNIANERLHTDEDEHAVFLSGNGPLVRVLREALARNEVETALDQNLRMNKKTAYTKAQTFIQNIHHFRDDALNYNRPPLEKVVIFDEAQRAWTLNQTAAFMKQKRGVSEFLMSEPHFLVSVMDRHTDWAVIICLVGGGQEINTGEAGLLEWFAAIRDNFPNWKVYASNNLRDYEYMRGEYIEEYIRPGQLQFDNWLHLAVSIRSYRSEKVASFVKAVLDNDSITAKALYGEIRTNYPIVMTRSLAKAKAWLKRKARGTERYGLLASSGAKRLRPVGINVQAEVDVICWFLNGKEDVRSSFYLEEVATEFDIQGLELDWTCVAWDADLRYINGVWVYKEFRGTYWQNINDETRAFYLKNAYRVLLTRARQGFVIFIPNGEDEDPTRKQEYYDGIFHYLQEIGVEQL